LPSSGVISDCSALSCSWLITNSLASLRRGRRAQRAATSTGQTHSVLSPSEQDAYVEPGGVRQPSARRAQVPSRQSEEERCVSTPMRQPVPMPSSTS
jgi:hypothetical protein